MTQTALKVTQASLNQTAWDWPQNMANHKAAIDEATEQGSDMVLMPELSISAYECNDDFQRTDNVRIYEALQELADYAYKKDPNLIVSVGHPWRLQLRDAFEASSEPNPDLVKNALYDRLNLPFNVQTLIGGGKVLGMTAKANLFRDERGYENRYFNEWSFRDVEELATLANIDHKYGTISAKMPDGAMVPFGRPLIYVTDGQGQSYVHATAICEEKWVATKFDGKPADDSRYSTMNIIPSIPHYLGTKDGLFLEIANASPPTRLKQDKHMHLNDLASGYADVVVDTDGLGTSGATFAQYGHRLVSQNGKTISSGQRLTFGQIGTTTSTVQINNADQSLQNKAHATLEREFVNAKEKPKATLAWNNKEAAWDNPANDNRWKEELIRNQALWMFDYMRKTKSKGIVEALSGGKDSSFNCAMVRVMVELAMNDLGVEGFCKEMAHLPYKDEILKAYKENGYAAAVERCMDDMLTSVYMGTNNSSFETWYAAKTLIDGGDYEQGGSFKGIGGKFLERNVQDVLDFYGYMFAYTGKSEKPSARLIEIKEEVKGLEPSLSQEEVSSKAERLYKMEMIEKSAEFLNASPYEKTAEDMKAWEKSLQETYPEFDKMVSAAIPEHTIGYENIQARGREVLIMLFANIEAKMAVANPNLDEAYGAYATFGGDLHSGTVNWNAGIHKSDQEALMEYLEEQGVQNVMDRIVSLAPANNNKPTAELQPKKDGKVVQNDEDALQGTFPQKAALARLRHHTKINTEDGDRWMNAGELFDKARSDKLFNDLDDNELFNSVTYFYQRWEGPAQHKIHATPIAPTHGESVDHQTSLRTPNLSGGSKDEIVQLGIDLMFKWSKQDGKKWDQATYKFLRAQAWQNKEFVDSFYSKLWNKDKSKENMSFNLRSLYDDVKDQGWQKVFNIERPRRSGVYPGKIK